MPDLQTTHRPAEITPAPANPAPTNPAPANPAPADLRAIRRILIAASDTQIRRVVALVDEMTQRGVADALIEPLRQRLAQLRPPRKLRFERLLFLPLDPVIVPPRAWRPADPTIPRNAVLPLSNTVRVALGPDAAAIDALIAGKLADDLPVIEQAGALLWPEAARSLASAPLPAEWADAGLNPSVHKPIASGVAAVLARRPALEAVIQDAHAGLLTVGEEAIEPIIAGLAEETTESQALVIAVLLARLPRAGPLLSVLDSVMRGSPPLRQASDRAADALLDRLDTENGIESRITHATLGQACHEVHRLGAMLSELEDRTGDPKRRTRLRGLRQRLDASCRTRFAGSLKDEFLAPLQAMSGAIDPPVQRLLETTARQLRTLEVAARPIGSGAVYDTLLFQAAAAITADGSKRDGVSVMRSARLVEILAGPDAAMALLGVP